MTKQSYLRLATKCQQKSWGYDKLYQAEPPTKNLNRIYWERQACYYAVKAERYYQEAKRVNS